MVMNSLKLMIVLKMIRESSQITSNRHKETGNMNRKYLIFCLAFAVSLRRSMGRVWAAGTNLTAMRSCYQDLGISCPLDLTKRVNC